MQAVVTVSRWRRYGADRLYVVSQTGAPIGSVDLVTGLVDVDDPRDDPDVRRAAQEYLRADVTELALPTQRTSSGGLSAADAELLEKWLGEPAGPPVRSRRSATTRQRLDRLTDRGWTVLHDVPVGRQGSVCEDLVIGPPGVLALGAVRGGGELALRGQVLVVDGVPTSQVRVAVMQARRIADLLRAAGGVVGDVRPVLTVAGASADPAQRRASGPLLIGRSDLVDVLLELPEVLTPGAMSALVRVARRPQTWQGGA